MYVTMYVTVYVTCCLLAAVLLVSAQDSTGSTGDAPSCPADISVRNINVRLAHRGDDGCFCKLRAPCRTLVHLAARTGRRRPQCSGGQQMQVPDDWLDSDMTLTSNSRNIHVQCTANMTACNSMKNGNATGPHCVVVSVDDDDDDDDDDDKVTVIILAVVLSLVVLVSVTIVLLLLIRTKRRHKSELADDPAMSDPHYHDPAAGAGAGAGALGSGNSKRASTISSSGTYLTINESRMVRSVSGAARQQASTAERGGGGGGGGGRVRSMIRQDSGPTYYEIPDVSNDGTDAGGAMRPVTAPVDVHAIAVTEAPTLQQQQGLGSTTDGQHAYQELRKEMMSPPAPAPAPPAAAARDVHPRSEQQLLEAKSSVASRVIMEDNEAYERSESSRGSPAMDRLSGRPPSGMSQIIMVDNDAYARSDQRSSGIPDESLNPVREPPAAPRSRRDGSINDGYEVVHISDLSESPKAAETETADVDEGDGLVMHENSLYDRR